MQPTNGIHETELAVPNIENEVRDVANEAPAPMVQAPPIVTGLQTQQHDQLAACHYKL